MSEFIIAKTDLGGGRTQEFALPTIGPVLNNPKVILGSFGLGLLKPLLYDLKLEDADKAASQTYLGTPVFSDVSFGEYGKADDGSDRVTEGRSVNYISKEGQPATETTPALASELTVIPGLTLVSVLMEIGMKKNIITTAVQGRNGTVKEYISDGDFDITIRGAICSKEANLYPQQEVEILQAICKVPESIPVTSRFLQMFSIYNVVITDLQIFQKEGSNNTALFEIKLLSDDPIDLKPKKD